MTEMVLDSNSEVLFDSFDSKKYTYLKSPAVSSLTDLCYKCPLTTPNQGNLRFQEYPYPAMADCCTVCACFGKVFKISS